MKRKSLPSAFFIGWRYLFSKKRHNIINVISIISMVGIGVSAAALIIVLSVYNGMEDFVQRCFNSFNPDIRITAVEGKSFAADSIPMDRLAAISDVDKLSQVVSDLALMTYGERQILVIMKGVDDDYLSVTGIDTLLIDGSSELTYDSIYTAAMLGAVVAGNIQLNLRSPEMLKVYYPKRFSKNLANPMNAFNTDMLIPSGVFASYTEYDSKMLFVPLDFARRIMNYEGELTSVELHLKNAKASHRVQKEVSAIVGDRYEVKDKYQQEETLYKTMKSEKLIIYVILAFILFVAAFNIIGTSGMLIIEKKNDVGVLYTMGARKSLVKMLFCIQGSLVSLIGGLAGLVIGFVVCVLQQCFHIVKLGDGGSGYLLDYYPVQMDVSDFLSVFFTILIISMITSFIPVRHIKYLTAKNQ